MISSIPNAHHTGVSNQIYRFKWNSVWLSHCEECQLIHTAFVCTCAGSAGFWYQVEGDAKVLDIPKLIRNDLLENLQQLRIRARCELPLPGSSLRNPVYC